MFDDRVVDINPVGCQRHDDVRKEEKHPQMTLVGAEIAVNVTRVLAVSEPEERRENNCVLQSAADEQS